MGERAPDDPMGRVQAWLDGVRAGEASARDELLAGTMDRLTRLARKMLRDYGDVGRYERTDDVLQNALVRLWRMLDDLVPPTPADYYRLAATQIRRELIDLSRRHRGPLGLATNQASVGPDGPTPDASESTYAPDRLAAWTEFHVAVDGLAEEDRAAFDLPYYQGLSQAEAASVLGVSERTVKRRWQAARVHLNDVLGGRLPGL